MGTPLWVSLIRGVPHLGGTFGNKNIFNHRGLFGDKREKTSPPFLPQNVLCVEPREFVKYHTWL